ncbi:MAG: shikimate kinase [Coriobacteriia bacterium]
MSHLLLVGFMGAGKSTVGRLVAEQLGLPFVDIDELVQLQDGRTAREIFQETGEPAFRALETSALNSVGTMLPSVVACGGGVVLSNSNRATLKRLGMVVYLRVTAAETLARVGDDSTRPLLSGAGGVLAAGKLLEAREALYVAVADATVDTGDRTPQDVAHEVVALMRERSAR